MVVFVDLGKAFDKVYDDKLHLCDTVPTFLVENVTSLVL